MKQYIQQIYQRVYFKISTQQKTYNKQGRGEREERLQIRSPSRSKTVWPNTILIFKWDLKPWVTAAAHRMTLSKQLGVPGHWRGCTCSLTEFFKSEWVCGEVRFSLSSNRNQNYQSLKTLAIDRLINANIPSLTFSYRFQIKKEQQPERHLGVAGMMVREQDGHNINNKNYCENQSQARLE